MRQPAVVEDKDGGRSSMAVGGMEDLTVAVRAHSLSVGCVDGQQQKIVCIHPDAGEVAEAVGVVGAVGAVAVAATEMCVVLVNAFEFGESQGYRSIQSAEVMKEFFQAVAD